MATLAVAAWTVQRRRGRVPGPGRRLGTGCQLAMSATTVCMLVAL